MLRKICVRIVRSRTGGKCSNCILKNFSGVGKVGGRIEEEGRRFGAFDGDFGRLKNIDNFDEAVFLIRSLAVNGGALAKKERSYYHFMMRRVDFFEKCSFEEFRIYALEAFEYDFGSGKQQDDIKYALMRILTEDISLPGIKIELCLEILEKYLAVYKRITDTELLIGIYELALSYINSSLEYCSLNQLLRAYYYNSFFLIEGEESLRTIESLVEDEIKREPDSLKKIANNWILVNLLWSISSTRYHHICLDLDQSFYISPEPISSQNFEIFKSAYEELRRRISSLNQAQVHR